MSTASRRRIAVLTSGRQDWGILRPVCAAIREEPSLELVIAAGGMHLSALHGSTADLPEGDGFSLDTRLAWPVATDGADVPASTQAGRALEVVGDWLRSANPDALLLVGDRLETAAAALAATLAIVPIVHLHGGEQTLGAFDDSLRHAITKLAHLHLVSHEEHRLRVLALGEDPATVHVIGAPGLDNLHRADLPDTAELESRLGIALTGPVVVVTVHPATLDADPAAAARAVAGAMDAVDATYVVTRPNSDPAGRAVARILEDAVEGRKRRVLTPALGERGYWGLLRIADAMLGNSSSGLIEAPALGLPVVNVGDRQTGRRRESNVIDVPARADDVTAALQHALAPGTRGGIPPLDPRLLDGHAGARAARIIAEWHPSRPPRKRPIAVDA